MAEKNLPDKLRSIMEGHNPPPASAILRAIPTGDRAEAGYNPPPPIVIRQGPQTPTPATPTKPPASQSE